jgi:hypothetical protein
MKKGELLFNATQAKSGSREDIINWLIETDMIGCFVRYFGNGIDTEDKIQDIWFEVLNIPEERWQMLYEQGFPIAKAYVARIIKNMLGGKCKEYYDAHINKEEIKDNEWWKKYSEEN